MLELNEKKNRYKIEKKKDSVKETFDYQCP